MSANEINIDERALATVNDALAQVESAVSVADARLARLFSAAFEDGDRALRNAATLRRTKGLDFMLKALDDRALFTRSHYFGFLRGHLFARGAREEAREALHELPEALRDMDALAKKRGDLMKSRLSLLDRADRSRLNEHRRKSHTPENDRTRHRDR